MTKGKRLAGTVKWFSVQKGFGFIAPDTGEEDLFVHQTSIRTEGLRTLTEGDAVEFSVERREDGREMAVDVTGPGEADVPVVAGGGRRGFLGFGSGGYGRGRGRGWGRTGRVGGAGGSGRGGYGGANDSSEPSAFCAST
ncbi:Glycine-rich protein 2 [Platanthera guangdongensis]|uniref:Glycine-rich protein 2 n=1 Tax=Platanthera guangdongensis TaxID=2320717 RepID=A0ABR2LQK4_9ASPA